MRIGHAREMNIMHYRLIQMETNQAQPRNNNNVWLKRNPPTEQRPPDPFESTKMMFHSLFRPC